MAVRLGFLSTYPPTQCGIATFSQALLAQLRTAGAHVGVVRLVDERAPSLPPVVHQWVAGSPGGAADVRNVLDRYDVAVLQHEYGIFGGPDGEDVLEVVRGLHVPVVTTLHTVLTSPTPNQHRVLAGIIEASAALVTMTETARDRLITGWGADPAQVTVIAHGAVDNRAAAHAPSIAPGAAAASRSAGRTTVRTWGLLSEGKGIEWALRGLAELRDRIASGGRARMPLYRIVGQTHPRVLEREGEAYRDSLVALTAELGLTRDVEFDSRYLTGPDLRRVVRDADLVLLPYDSRDQVTSGVLTEAVAAGKPVISTTFPHAVELLASGAGLLVPQGDPLAIADALERVLTVRGLADGMAATSHRLAEAMLWPAVARRYTELATALLVAPVKAAV